ncbi:MULTISPECIES: sugar ABC transporter substrate-binding protein [unclassified Chelatococcus]|uniref:ABC transporter substrate-binding protein n=1 Tax=unclassified Chelatococcus TaxID=2638111 RepID=UPI001BCDD325|nr:MULTISPECIES: sugar ABC transporter substrate-binding protein [unclassified Chelatococcus]MBS7699893.1 sugar ABC transporter substrate-binding protein [Chelatococcus sp. YT9]MBX3558761.1 sugar ABC transporter substrate-binding protein [Chelatococcus sp.]
MAFKMFRREVLARAAGLAALMLACGASTTFAQNGTVDWQQAKGTTLFIGMNKHVFTDTIRPLIPEFEKLTGIKVQIESYSQDEYMNKRLVDLSSGAGTFDVVMMDQAIVQYSKAGWVEELDKYITNPKYFDSTSYDVNDFLPSLTRNTFINGKRFALPVTGEAQILYYRKDVLDAAGMAVPTSFDELYKTAVALNQPGKMAGMLLRGEKIHTAWNSSGFIWSYGGKVFDNAESPTKATFDSPEAVAAITMYAKLLQDAGPVGVGNYTWYETVSDFQQGKAAMYLDASVFMSQIEDPKKSTVSGKVGYASMPAGPAGAMANTGAWMLSISASSKNKPGAALFMSWVTSKDVGLKIGEAAGIGARKSVFEAPSLRSKYPAAWAEATIKSMMPAEPTPGPPRITAIDEWLDIYGGAVNATILKQGTAQSNLSSAAERMDKALARSK